MKSVLSVLVLLSLSHVSKAQDNVVGLAAMYKQCAYVKQHSTEKVAEFNAFSTLYVLAAGTGELQKEISSDLFETKRTSKNEVKNRRFRMFVHEDKISASLYLDASCTSYVGEIKSDVQIID